MLTDIVLTKIPFPSGKYTSIIMRVPDPNSVTWEGIFAYIEKRTEIPRAFFGWIQFQRKIYLWEISKISSLDL